MRDVIFFILIMILSLGVLSFAPNNTARSAQQLEKSMYVPERAPASAERMSDLREDLDLVEVRCNRLEQLILDSEAEPLRVGK